MENSANNKKSINDLGKYGLIDHITSDFRSHNRSTVIAAGDDAAAIDSSGELTLVTTDMLLEGIHFNLVYTPLKHLGYKSVIRAISDIYAMNGKPSQVLISLGISSRFTTEDIEEFYGGIRHACNKYFIDLAGGDTSSSLTGLIISVTAVGHAASGKIIKRSGARPNDLICVTGDLGASYMGLQLLERERRLFETGNNIKPDLSGYEYILGRQLKPEFPSEVIDKLEEKGIVPTSMIDITEGLASDLLQICRQSEKGCRIFQEKIPVDRETAAMAAEFGIDPLVPALNGGEDYELLFTVPLEKFESLKQLDGIKIIGHITPDENGSYLVSANGEEIGLTAQGWRS
ncbi:MAG: thiamine-phosphate kinase [Bacteroidales bacterium]|jgi:thiamine-monophosphate kinase